jgi:3'(2'), 5'-bisphosphate nucleotidase
MIDPHSPEIKFAIETVRQAAILVKQVQAEMVTGALTKEDKSPVTVADFAAQALIAHHLMDAFPNDPLVGEEDAGVLETPEEAAALERVTNFVSKALLQATPDKVTAWINYGNAGPSDRFWTVDPIDGTKGFLRGGQYAVALALIENSVVQIGVLGCPNLTGGTQQDIGGPGSLIIAQRGQGTWTTPLVGEPDFTQLHVSGIRENAAARFLRSFEAGHTNVGQLDLIAQEMRVSAEPVRLDSQAKYAILAGGAGDLIFRLISPKMPDYKEKIWDQAAGSLIAEEADGMVTDLDGKPLDFTQGRRLEKNRGVVASNTHLHKAALNAIKIVGA